MQSTAAEAHVCAVVYMEPCVDALEYAVSYCAETCRRLSGAMDGSNEWMQGGDGGNESGFGGQWCACWAVLLVTRL
jgi:hypothetical protein